MAAAARAGPITNNSPALRIEESGAHVRVAHSASINLTSALTVEFWTCLDPADENPGVEIVKRGDGNAGYGVGLNLGTRFVGSIFERHTNLVNNPPDVALAWHHFAWTFDGRLSRLYVDGTLLRELTFVGTILPTTSDLVFGIGVEGDGSWNGATARGWYDEIRLWNVARSPAQILGAFSTGLTGSEPGLVGYWSFDEGDARDASPFGNHGNLLGGANVGTAHVPIPEPSSFGLVLAVILLALLRRCIAEA